MTDGPYDPPVPLRELWGPSFPAPIRSRGAEYYRSGRVEITDRGEDWLEAFVRGSSVYSVELAFDVETDELRAYCSCRAFEKYGPCKHVWACVLALEETDPGLDEPDDEDSVAPAPADDTNWRARVSSLARVAAQRRPDPWATVSEPGRELRCVVDVEASIVEGQVVVETVLRQRKKDGTWGKPRGVSPSMFDADPPVDPVERRMIALVRGARMPASFPPPYYASRASGLTLSEELADELLPFLAQHGRLDWKLGRSRGGTVEWDPGPPWELELRLDRDEQSAELAGGLRRGDERMTLDEPVLLSSRLLFTDDHLARFEPHGAMAWCVELRRRGSLRVPIEHLDELAGVIPARLGESIPELPSPRPSEPRPCLTIESPARRRWDGRLTCRVAFDYEGRFVEPDDPRASLATEDGRVLRDFEREGRALAQFLDSGPRRSREDARDGYHATIAAGRVDELVRTLLEAGWLVEAEGRLQRRPSGSSVSVRSGLDWFELDGGIEFGDQVATLPALLAAAREKTNTVRLGDGSVGLLPERWLDDWGLLELARHEGGQELRLPREQGWLLDALLAERENVDVDRGFRRYRERLVDFERVRPQREPRGFRGELRKYQREGLGWFAFLRGLGLGGCLADDMGLGKTVQVLALLETRRTRRPKSERRPSLVVAPRSLLFNWIDEAARFAPKLDVVDYTGTQRHEQRERIPDANLVVTTYGTLRRDIVDLKDVPFDYVVLDEAQAIKNAGSQSAKAARLLTADHRLALSGTPIENHLGELWSLFEFLNPGMLGRSSVFKSFAGGPGRSGDDTDLAKLSRALRPFFLRRTKEQVLQDLPEKTEQALVCELGRRQRKQYDELRDHYRASLLARADDVGLARMKIHVLEALLRLRQCACHEALIDKSRAGETSAKLDALLPRLEELAEEGHKALVFSQFTSFLAIVRQRLDERGLRYTYLDGRTRKRKEKVDQFQSDPTCPLFLISLKAGGHGLNLTAADYVFLLDPWWNPAVESQAIDRAHRIGRTRPVVAYRLIARDTIEEKVLELQAHKRELAEALLGSRKGTLGDLTREELERLLS